VEQACQARRQDLAEGGGKNQKEGPKTRRGGHIFKILYWMYATTRRPTVKWEGTDFKWGDVLHCPPPAACVTGKKLVKKTCAVLTNVSPTIHHR